MRLVTQKYHIFYYIYNIARNIYAIDKLYKQSVYQYHIHRDTAILQIDQNLKLSQFCHTRQLLSLVLYSI